MPICPGCERSVPYDRLDVHERYCGGIWGQSSPAAVALERLDRRLQRMEDDVEQRLVQLDRRSRSARERQNRK